MNATKFTFDTVFESGKDVVSDAMRGRRRRVLTETEIEQICAEAKTEGMKAGEVRALEAVAAAARETAAAVARTAAQMAQERAALLAQSSALAFALARKLAHIALAEFPQGEVEAALREAMHQAIGEPRILLRAAPQVAEAIAPRLADIAHEEGFDGRVQVSPDAALKRADCRIEWRGGGAERAEAALESALQEVIARHFGEGAGAVNDEGAAHGQ